MHVLSLLTLTAGPVLFATLKVAVVAVTGFWLAKRSLLHEMALRDLSVLVVQVTVPCLVFSTAARGLGGLGFSEASLLVAAAPAIIGMGWLIGWVMHRLSGGCESVRKPTILSTAYANSSYLPIAVGTSVMPALASHFPNIAAHTLAQTSVVCISIYLVLYSPLFWGVGFWWMKGEAGGKLKWSQILSPPVIGLAAGYLVGLTPIHLAMTPNSAPFHFLFDGIEDLGALTIPLANLILGGMLCTARMMRLSQGAAPTITPLGLIAAVTGKLLIVPALAFAVIFLTRGVWNHGDALTLAVAVVMLEAATPGATNLAVMGRSVAGSKTGVGIAEILLWQYPLALITIPFWLTLLFALPAA